MNPQQVIELRNSIKDCSDRGLSVASKWSSELLLSISADKRKTVSSAQKSTFSTSTPARSPGPSLSFAEPSPAAAAALAIPMTPSQHPHAPQVQFEPEDVRIQELEWEAQDEDVLATARACIGAREFLRAVHLLRDGKSAKARFLSIYSQFMASEKKTLRDWHKIDNKRHQPPVPLNTSLLDLLEKVKNTTNPWLLFLKALFLCGLNRREEAIESALLSIAGYPWNWSTWILLGSCIGDGEEVVCHIAHVIYLLKRLLAAVFSSPFNAVSADTSCGSNVSSKNIE